MTYRVDNQRAPEWLHYPTREDVGVWAGASFAAFCGSMFVGWIVGNLVDYWGWVGASGWENQNFISHEWQWYFMFGPWAVFFVPFTFLLWVLPLFFPQKKFDVQLHAKAYSDARAMTWDERAQIASTYEYIMRQDDPTYDDTVLWSSAWDAVIQRRKRLKAEAEAHLLATAKQEIEALNS